MKTKSASIQALRAVYQTLTSLHLMKSRVTSLSLTVSWVFHKNMVSMINKFIVMATKLVLYLLRRYQKLAKFKNQNSHSRCMVKLMIATSISARRSRTGKTVLKLVVLSKNKKLE
jgi:triacylglycerol esterase/lipase EstA (alpha/beta hydrolase family)